jgi:hypothetical protein
MALQQWSDLNPRVRQLIVAGAAVEGALKIAALIDIKRSSPEQIRGGKKVWTAGMLLNSAGLIPLSYFVWGRRSAAPRIP